MKERLTEEELNNFISRAVVQLNPELTQSLMSIIAELIDYRNKIENGTLIEMTKKEKQKIIEDMATLIQKGVDKCIKLQPRGCDDKCKYYPNELCANLYCAEYLYRAGYRKVQKEEKENDRQRED